MQKGLELAEKLECWFMAYKENWRATSKEGHLHHILRSCSGMQTGCAENDKKV